MSKITNAKVMHKIKKADTNEGTENFTNQGVAEQEIEDQKDGYVYMKLPDGEVGRVYLFSNISKFFNSLHDLYTSLLEFRAFSAAESENPLEVAKLLTHMEKVNEELLQFLDE